MAEVAFNAAQRHGYAPPMPIPPLAPPVTPQPVVSDEAEEYTGADDDPPAAAPASAGRVAVQVVDRLRTTAERGTTTVPDAVLTKVAARAVREVPGVYAFDTGAPLAVQLDGRAATVSIHLVVEYGFAVYAVTDKVRTKVISELENLFGLDVTAVDIVVEDIHIPESDASVEE